MSELITESWVDGRKVENEDFFIIEKSGNSDNTYKFFLPWYACTIDRDNPNFFPLEDQLGKDLYEKDYNLFMENMRKFTLLEF